MSQTQMNMMRSKDKGQQRAVTSAMRNEVKNTGAQTSPTPKKAKAVKDSRSAIPEAKKIELIAKMKADKAKKPKKKSLLSRLFGGNKKKPAVPSNDIAAKKGGSMKKKYAGTNLAVRFVALVPLPRQALWSRWIINAVS